MYVTIIIINSNIEIYNNEIGKVIPTYYYI